MYKILLVDDNKAYADKLTDALRKQGYDTFYVENPIAAIEEFAKGTYDLVISDFMMDHLNGVRFLSTIKSIKPDIKCILLTGFPTEEIEMAALDIYVDEYLSKDKSLAVLCKYVEQLLLKSTVKEQKTESKLYSTEENIVLDIVSQTVYKNNELMPLTRKEFDLLRFFLQNKGVALSREEIVEKLWTQTIEEIDMRVVDGHIKKLREKLRSFSIMSVRGYGYKWNE